MSVESVMPSNHLILCCPLLLLPSIFPSIKVFSKESVLPIRWPKCLTSFRMDWLDLLAVQGTLKSLLQQFKSINSLALSLLYGPTLTFICDYWENHSFTIWAFIGKVMSLLLNMLSRLVITFLSRSKRLFNFVAAVSICSDFGVPRNKVSHCFRHFPIYLPWSSGTRCHDLSFLNVEL